MVQLWIHGEFQLIFVRNDTIRHLTYEDYNQTRSRSHKNQTGGLFTVSSSLLYTIRNLHVCRIQRLTLEAFISADFHCCRSKSKRSAPLENMWFLSYRGRKLGRRDTVEDRERGVGLIRHIYYYYIIRMERKPTESRTWASACFFFSWSILLFLYTSLQEH